MNTRVAKIQRNKRSIAGNCESEKQHSLKSVCSFTDNRSEAIAQCKLQESINNSVKTNQIAQMQIVADSYSAVLTQREGKLSKMYGGTSHPVLQAEWDTETYKVDKSDRTLHVDEKNVTWGGTVASGNHVNHEDEDKPRAILYETISTQNGAADIIGRLGLLGNLWDVGLTLVLNMPYTPDKIYDDKTETTANRTQGNTLDNSKGTLAGNWANLTGGWNGPPIQVAIAAWERREKKKDGGSELEKVQASVPYSTLRRIAGSNAGAGLIDAELNNNHEQVWHKMGDDDMPVQDPNGVSAEMSKLEEVEEEGQIYAKNAIVTFGYNLTTPGKDPIINTILRELYKTEMKLRDEIHALGAPIYPSEPTTYYRPRVSGSMDEPWQNMENEKTGGSGQQLEGAKLLRAMGKHGGYTSYAFHTVMVDTSAGGRNDNIIELLEGWYDNGQGMPNDVKASALEDEINKLDQCAMREGEYLNKVVKNLGIRVETDTYKQIQKKIIYYRQVAVSNACNMMKEELRKKLYLAMHQKNVEHWYRKMGLD